jgi:hypothetical protein
MAEVVNETVDAAVEAVNVANVKTIAEMAAWSTAQSMKDAVSHSKRLDILAETYLARALKLASEVDPAEAAATLKLLSGNDIAATLANLSAVVGQVQQVVKAAQTTPPVTATS